MMPATPVDPFLPLAALVAIALAMRGVSWLCDRPALLWRLLMAGPRAVVWALAGAHPAARPTPQGDEPPKGPTRHGPDVVYKAYAPMRTTMGFTNWH